MMRNISIFSLTFSFAYSLVVYGWVAFAISSEQTRIIRLEQIYALTAVAFLYLALLADFLLHTFPHLSFKKTYLRARDSLMISAFYFGLLHTTLAFFGQLGGFEGLGFLSEKYLIAIILSFTALVILGFINLLTLTGGLFKKRISGWKLLQKLGYLAGFFILIHALMLGTHFYDLSVIIPQIFLAALAFLLGLESIRIDDFIKKRFNFAPRFGPTFLVFLGFIIAVLVFYIIPRDTPFSIGIHAQHVELARQAQQGNAGRTNTLPNIPGLKGDRTKRFTVDIETPASILPNTDVPLTFRVYDASSGKQIVFFERVYEKLMHFIIVDSELQYFNHIHPEQIGTKFTITTQFPKAGTYHLYVDFQPVGAVEQQFAFSVNVGGGDVKLSSVQPDTNLTKTFGNYEVSLTHPKPLKSSLVSIGQQELEFTIRDARSNEAIKTLKPYLAAFGHLVMINKETYDYIHVHPSSLVTPGPDEDGGPVVKFMPLGIYGPIKPGIYRVFAQFNPDNKLFTADFTVAIE
jgi:DMSO/TMAO reductase YedYZ heme-binding membrane subunit